MPFDLWHFHMMYDYDSGKLFIPEYSTTCVRNKSEPQFYGVVHQTSTFHALGVITIYQIVYAKLLYSFPLIILQYRYVLIRNLLVVWK